MQLSILYGSHCVSDWHWFVEPGAHEGCTLWSVWGGQGRLRLGSRVYSLRAGDMFFIDYSAAVEGTESPDDPLFVRFIDFSPAEIAPELSLPVHRHLRQPAFMNALLDKVSESQLKGAAAALSVWTKAVLLTFSAQTEAPAVSPYEEKITAMVQEMQLHPEQEFHTEAMAARCNLTPDHFIRVFKELHGTTPYAFLLSLRLDMAVSLLANSSMSVSETAAVCGFPDVYSFSKFFKSKIGEAPTLFRKRQG